MNKPNLQLSLQSLSLIAGFMVWVLISSLMPIINEEVQLTSGQLSFVTAVPVILGSVLRVPLGFYTNRFGAKNMFILSFIVLLFPVFYLSIADSFFDLILSGLFLGVAGATFSIGVTSLPKYYSKDKHGFVNGIYALGNAGTAITTFGAPVIASSIGWENTVRLYLVLLLVFIVFNFFLGDKDEAKEKVSMVEQLKSVYRNQILWFLSLFYFITFGAFVAFTVYLPNFLVENYGLTPGDAGLRTAGFIVLATLIRPVGGFLADKLNAHIILMIIFLGISASGVLLSFTPTIELYTVGTLSVAVFAGIGNGTVFKLVPLHFSKQAGVVNGIVAAIGGLGGFFPPIVLSTVFNLTGHYAIGFMALSEFALVSFVIVVYMYYQDRLSLERKIIEGTAEGIMITDKHAIIQDVNPAFTRITGYEEEEAIGKKPSILSSGKHDKSFYEKMWQTIHEQGYWEGEIWNKRKSGEIYVEWLTISQLNNDKGNPQYYVGTISDISAAKDDI